MRKIVLGLALVLGAGLAFTVTVLPGLFESQTNVVTDEPLPAVRADAARLHASLQIADLHGDTLLWKRSVLDKASRGQIDLPRLETGNVALQVFSSVSKTPKGQNYDSNPSDTDNITLLAMAQLQPVKTWFSVHERSMYHGRKLEVAAKASNSRLMLIRKPDDVDRLLAARAAGDQVTGALYSVEGLQNLEGKAENLDRLYGVGMRMAGLVHFFDNELAGSMHGEAKGGLTPFGRRMVRAMEAKGIIVDIAHSSHKSVADILAMARRPVVSSHGGVQAVCKVNRNLSDTEIRGVAATGGIIGIGYWDGALCSTDPKKIAQSIRHVRDLVGIQHVALGSDFDGAVTTRFDTSQIVQVTQALIDIGLSEAEIRSVMGGNTLRLIKQGIEPQPGKAL
ncbi:dipeptidase [Blastomonas sp. AAP53]|uniref:dipeptidase n=1 Tax=Blastomonas sp. AAP53 TaxID=1248760 RepID=UPI00058DDEFA|nr:dipeptidase [Blastomonas sp. AAP53]